MNSKLSAEHLGKGAKGEEVMVEIVGSADDLLFLWTSLSCNLAKQLGMPLAALAIHLLTTSPKEEKALTNRSLSIELSRFVQE